MKIKKIAVIGAGTMGNGIAHVSALTGFDTILMDIKDEFVGRGLNTFRTYSSLISIRMVSNPVSALT
jgi:3-hydroxyacyl-CoA dehydrogenase